MDAAKAKFCSNTAPSGGFWGLFYQAPEDVAWRAISLTHVDYPEGIIF